MATRNITADRGDAGRRLDHVLRRRLSDVNTSRTRVQQWIEDGQVTVNGAIVRRVSARAQLGDRVAVRLPKQAPPRPMTPQDISLDIVFEDECLLALNKSAGIVVHPGYRNDSRTVLNALLWRARAWTSGHRPSLVGRLDKFTSGIVIVAKTAAVHAALQRALTSKQSEKNYLAVVLGRVKTARGRIDLPLGRDRHDRRKVVTSPDGAPSVTLFERLATTGRISLLRCTLVTGRMHQIRVHLAARGWSVVGDRVYGDPAWSTIKDPELVARLRAFPRQALHAWRIQFPHPATGQLLKLEAPVPGDLRLLMAVTGLGLPSLPQP